jgi:hypothetical protein
MKDFYIALKAYLLATVPSIQHIRMWNNQLDFMESGEQIPFLFPAVFVDFSTIEFSDVGDKWQTINLEMNLHICSELWNDTDQEENLIVFDLKDEIYKALGQVKIDNSTPLVRILEQTDTTHTNIYHYIQTWSFSITDNSQETWIELTNVLLNLTAIREITNYDLMTKPKYE